MRRFSAVVSSPLFVCRVLSGIFWAAILSGCTGSGEGLDNSGRPLGEAAQLPLSAEFDSIQAHIFTPICSVCHAGGNAPEGLRLDAANSYNLLVGVASTQQPSTLRVRPGNPDSSYIIQKLEGTAAFGERMPFGGPYLPASTIAVVRQWITEGALRSPASVSAASFALSTTAPQDGDVLEAGPAQVMLGFTRDLDTNRIATADIRLQRIDLDDPQALGAAISATVAVPASNPRALLVIPGEPLVEGHYRVVIADPYGVGLADLDGRPLAGHAGGTNDVVIRFTVGSTR